jgi:hypothetical protein
MIGLRGKHIAYKFLKFRNGSPGAAGFNEILLVI